MFVKFSILLGLLVGSILAEAPLKSGPYPAAGFRPQRPFNLPGEYLPPRELEQAQQPQKFDVEISKERVDFIGQISGNSLVASNQPQNAYLPPDNDAGADDDFLQVQELPNLVRPQFLNKQQVFVRPIAQPRPQQSQPQQQNFRPQTQPQNIKPQTTQQNFGAQTQPQSFRPQPQPQSFRPQMQPQPQQQQFFPQMPSKPAQQYGLPESSATEINVVYPDPRNLQANDEHDYNAIEALNAAVDAYNRAQLKKDSEPATHVENEEDADDTNVPAGYPLRFQQGQYYVLGPDNALQRVMFTSTQDEQEAKTKGFTAQLKYTPVGEIRDPVFKYNERGQLVRILKK